jgi:glycosyltransferase involved in cell wall biosynthesis
MKIIFVQDSLGSGGAERSNLELWYYLREVGVEIKIVVLEHRQKGVENEVLGANFDVTFLKKRGLFKEVDNIVTIIQEYKPDIVHSVLFKSRLRVRLAKLKTKFLHIESLVTTPYQYQRFKDPKINGLGFFVGYLIDVSTAGFGVDHFHANGTTVLKHYKKFLLASKNKFTLINRGRKSNEFLNDHETKVNMRKELGTTDAFQIVLVGRQEFAKAIDIALQAIDVVKKKNKAIKLVLVGREGNHSKVINELIQKLKLEDVVIQLGHRHDVYKILASSDMFLFTSRFEGFPGVLVEALSAGLPIVCSNIPNNLEIIEGSINGLLFKVDDPLDCSIKIQELMDNLNIRNQMSALNQVKFEENYKLDKINESMLNLYQKLSLNQKRI